MSTHITADLAPLPGARIWLNRLHADLAAGRSCLWLLPQALIGDSGHTADALLDQLLLELRDFLLLSRPEQDRDGPLPPSTLSLSAPGTHWSGLAPVLDFDDGLSAVGLAATDRAPKPASARSNTPETPAEALAELMERLAKDLPRGPGSPFLASASLAAERERTEDGMTESMLMRLAGGKGGRSETRTLVIRAWREPVPLAATHLLRRLVAISKEAGLPPHRRPRGLVVATTEDLPADLPQQLAREDIAVHWWWGATGHLDTATVAALARPMSHSHTARHQLLEAVAQATVTEVCGPFLDVAASLAREWDGHPETLVEELRRAVESEDLAWDPVPENFSRSPGHRPDTAMLPAWNNGQLESWEGRLRRHPAHELPKERVVATRIWLAQNRALLPLLDDAREEFTATIRERARVPLSQIADRYGPRPATGSSFSAPGSSTAGILSSLELGAMWGAHLNGDIALNRPQYERLRTLWDARNRLSHRTHLEGVRLHALVAELCP